MELSLQLQGQEDQLEDCHWSDCLVALPGIMLNPNLATGVAECCCEAVHWCLNFRWWRQRKWMRQKEHHQVSADVQLCEGLRNKENSYCYTIA